MGSTSLDGGDVFRVLRRTAELLRTVALAPALAPVLRRNARAALRAMDRYPISDNALGLPAVLVDEDEAEDDDDDDDDDEEEEGEE